MEYGIALFMPALIAQLMPLHVFLKFGEDLSGTIAGPDLAGGGPGAQLTWGRSVSTLGAVVLPLNKY